MDDAALLAALRPQPLNLAEIDAVPGMAIVNQAVTFKLSTQGRNINLERLCQTFACASEFRPHDFGAVILRIYPKLTVLIFAGGACNCVGASTYNKARFGCQVARYMIQSIHKRHLPFLNKLCFRNTVTKIKFGFNLNLIDLVPLPGDTFSWTDDFPALRYRMHDPNVRLSIFDTGSVTVMGKESRRAETIRAYRKILPLLEAIRTDTLPGTSAGRYVFRKEAKLLKARQRQALARDAAHVALYDEEMDGVDAFGVIDGTDDAILAGDESS